MENTAEKELDRLAMLMQKLTTNNVRIEPTNINIYYLLEYSYQKIKIMDEYFNRSK